MPNNKYDDEVFDLILSQAIEEYSDQEMDAILDSSQSTPAFEPSEAFSHKIDTLIASSEKGKRRRFRIRVVLIAAALMALLVTLVASPASAYMEKLYNYFLKSTESTHTTARLPDAYSQYQDTLRSLPDEWDKIYVPYNNRTNTVKPKISTWADGGTTLVEAHYTLGNEYLVFTQQMPIESSFGFDIERGSAEEITINGVPAYVFSSEDEIWIKWSNEYNTFNIQTGLDRDAAVSFAESLVEVKR